MNARFLKPAAALLALALGGCAHSPPATAPTRPALLVMISIDQLRADLLTRYEPYFTGGFRRLIDQGAYFTAVHDHAASETAPGHATLSTGVVPARSGIAGNDWQEKVGDRWVTVYNVADSLSPIVGAPQAAGMSPRNLLREGVADWVVAADPRAKVVSLGGKDRSAILMAGKARGEVYWFNADLGRFITSRYYGDRYPEWVERFNERSVSALLDTVWTEQSPMAARSLARPDTAAYEADGVNTFFPHRYSREGGRATVAQWAARTPFIDRLVLRLARESLDAVELGRDEVTDFLALGLAQTDYVGHGFGPLSREQLDNLIRLDRELGDFFRLLDRKVGAGRWAVALSADHGVLTMPEWRAAHGEPGHRVTREERQQLADAVTNAAPSGPAAVAEAARRLPFVADAYTFEELVRGQPRDSFAALFQKSYYPNRVAGPLGPQGVEIRLKEGYYMGNATGTSHGSAYLYDRIVPLIFMGPGVPAGRHAAPVRTVDLAPTLSTLGGIRFPGDLDGRSLPLAPPGR